MKSNVVMVLNSGEQMGGVERHIGDLVKGLSADFNFTICCKYGPMVEEYKQSGASFVELYPRLDLDPVFILKFFRLLKSLKPKVVHAHELKPGFNAMFAAFTAQIPVRIYHTHTPITKWQLPNWKKKTLFKLNLIANRIAGNFFSTKVIALTEEIRRERINAEHITFNKIEVIPNGIDVNKFLIFNFKFLNNRHKIRKEWGVGEKDFVIGNISRLTEEKAHSILLNAFAKLSKEKFPYLVIAGEGYLKSSLVNLASNLGISERVKFLGKFADEDKIKILSGFDLFVFPTFAEGFGIVMIEAMAAKIPIIASDLPVLQEVAGDTIMYFKMGDFENLSDVLSNYSRDDALVEHAFERVRNRYSMDKFLQSYRDLYNSK